MVPQSASKQKSTVPAKNRALSATSVPRPHPALRIAAFSHTSHIHGRAPKAFSTFPLHGVTVQSSGQSSITIPSGCRFFASITPEGRTLAAGFYAPSANAVMDYQVFLPSTVNDLPLSGVSDPMYSDWSGTTGHSRGFEHASHPYKLEVGAKGKFLVLPSGMRPDQFVNGVQDVAISTEHTMSARYYMESAHVQFDLSTLYNGSARVWACSTDDLDMPKTTTVFAPSAGEQNSDVAIRYRRPIPSATAKISINDLTSAVRSVNVGASQHACFDATARLCAPSVWRCGGLDEVMPTTVGTYTEAEAVLGLFPMANPFTGCATSGFFVVVDAIGADVNLSMAVRMTHFIEHAPRLDTSSSDTQMRSVFLRPSMHSTVSSEEVRDSKSAPLALSGHGTTFEESGKCLLQAQKSRTGVGIPPTQIIPSQTKILAPHPETALERFEDGAMNAARMVGGFVRTGAEIAKQGASIFNDVKGILSLF